jgi:hypothetical protein
MKDKIIESFKATLIEIDSITAVYNNKEASSENLQESLKAASSLLFESYSNLNIFVELVENTIYVGYKSNLLKKELSKKKQLKKVEIKIIYNQLVNILIENKNHLNLIPIKYIVFRNQYESMLYQLSSPGISEDIVLLNKSLIQNKMTKEEITTNLGSILFEISRYLQQILTHNIYLIFENLNITYTNEFVLEKDYKKEYINSWVNCTIEVIAISRNSGIDYWDEIIDLKLDNEHFERIEKYQEKLFNERVDSQVRVALSDIEELNDSQQIEQINKELNLISGFFNGDLSKLTVKRLKEIIRFSKPRKLILAYDKVKKDNFYLAYEYLIYNIGRPRMYSNFFVATFFIKYIEELKEILNTKKNNTSNQTENIQEDQEDLVSEEKLSYIVNLFNDLSITVNGVSILTPRKKGAIRGIVEALREKLILPNLGLASLCQIMAKEINLDLKSELDASNTSEKYKKEALQYINNNPFH